MADFRNIGRDFNKSNRLQNIATNNSENTDIEKVYNPISTIESLALIMQLQNKQIELLEEILKLLKE